MSWLWMNLPLAAVFFLAWTVIPLWMVIKRPDRGPSYGTVPAGTLGSQVPVARSAGNAGQAATEPVSARWNRRPVRVRQMADRPMATVPRPRQARVPA